MTANDHALRIVESVTGSNLPPCEESTHRIWHASDGHVLLSYDSSDRRPYFIPSKFHSLDELKELSVAIGKAIEDGRGA